MPRLIGRPALITGAGSAPKVIEEYIGRVNTGHDKVSVAKMVSPEGWEEKGQRPEFQEIMVVLRGALRVEHKGGGLVVRAGQALITDPGEWVRYSSPDEGGAEYIAVCVPAFSPSEAHREEAATDQIFSRDVSISAVK